MINVSNEVPVRHGGTAARTGEYIEIRSTRGQQLVCLVINGEEGVEERYVLASDLKAAIDNAVNNNRF